MSDQRAIETRLFSDAASIKAVADPHRMRMLLELSGEPRTAKQLASILGVPRTRLYHHLKILEEAGFIEVVGSKMVRGIEERSYVAVDVSWAPAPSATPELLSAGVLRAIFQVAAAELEFAAAGDAAGLGGPDSAVPVLSMTRLRLTPAAAAEFQEKIRELISEYGDPDRDPGAPAYHALFAAYRVPSA